MCTWAISRALGPRSVKSQLPPTFYRKEKCNSERLDDLPRVIQQGPRPGGNEGLLSCSFSRDMRKLVNEECVTIEASGLALNSVAGEVVLGVGDEQE